MFWATHRIPAERSAAVVRDVCVVCCLLENKSDLLGVPTLVLPVSVHSTYHPARGDLRVRLCPLVAAPFDDVRLTSNNAVERAHVSSSSLVVIIRTSVERFKRSPFGRGRTTRRQCKGAQEQFIIHGDQVGVWCGLSLYEMLSRDVVW